MYFSGICIPLNLYAAGLSSSPPTHNLNGLIVKFNETVLNEWMNECNCHNQWSSEDWNEVRFWRLKWSSILKTEMKFWRLKWRITILLCINAKISQNKRHGEKWDFQNNEKTLWSILVTQNRDWWHNCYICKTTSVAQFPVLQRLKVYVSLLEVGELCESSETLHHC
jgi:hypothetical protein